MQKIKKTYHYLQKLILSDIEKTGKVIVISTFLLLLGMSIFRFANYDEMYYLRETWFISDLIKQGIWIGNYGVGLHGWIFKLPVALIFFITGHSVFVATLSNIILSVWASYIFFGILYDHFKLRGWAIIGLCLFVSNYSFLSWSLTYHRETPVIFALLLFIKCLLSKKKPIVLGFLLLLILEAKEYVFYIASLTMVIWQVYVQIKNHKTIFIKFIGGLVSEIVTLFSPSVTYLTLMFTTPLVPINMFNASLLLLTRGAFGYQIRHIEVDNYATKASAHSTGFIQAFRILIHKAIGTGLLNTFLDRILTVAGYVFGYCEKLFYLSAFSFQCIPIVILLPAIFFSFSYFREIKKTDKSEYIFPFILFWIYLGIYFIKISQGRYLYPLLPIALIFFTLFLKQCYNMKTSRRLIKYLICLLSVYIIILAFYPDNMDIKMLFEVLASLVVLGILILFYKYKKKVFILCIAFFLVGCMFLLNITTWLFYNQFANSQIWGINGETKTIANIVDKDQIIYINETGITNQSWLYMVKFYREDPSLTAEWKWELLDWIPKKDLLAQDEKTNTYYFLPWESPVELKELVETTGITKVLIVRSTYKNITFYQQNTIPALSEQDWIKLEEIVPLKNKEVYVFSIN